MPIRINLLAEAQAAEEMRRRDPVKRAIWLACFAVSLVLLWSLSLQAKIWLANGELKRIEATLSETDEEYKQIVAKQNKVAEIKTKLASLEQLATNRFLWASTMDALQMATVENVHLVRIRTSQTYVMAEAVKARTNNNRVTPAKPASATERIVLTLDARDTSPNPGDKVNKFKEAIANSAYFQVRLDKTNEIRLTSLTPPQIATDTGRAYVQFTLEAQFPEKVR